MAREKFHTLTEQMFYILLCLRQPHHGMDIMDLVPEMTGGRVRVGSGTLYNLLDQFLTAEMIREVRSEGRRRNYELTDKGRQALEEEYRRLRQQVDDFEKYMEGEGETC